MKKAVVGREGKNFEGGGKKENGVLFEDVGSSCIIYPLVRPLLQVSVSFLPSRFFRVHLEEERGRARRKRGPL